MGSRVSSNNNALTGMCRDLLVEEAQWIVGADARQARE